LTTAGIIVSLSIVGQGTADSAIVTSPSPTVQKDEVSTAKAAAKARGSEVEITSARREDSTLYALPDGTFRVEMHAGPIRVSRNGQFVPIDTTLVEDNGELKPKAAKSNVSFSVGGPGPVVRFDDGHGLRTVGWPKALSRPQISGNEAIYRNAVTGGDLVLKATPTGFTQSIVLRERPKKPTEIRIPVDLPQGQQYKLSAGGKLRLTGAKDETLATAGPLRMADAGAERSPDTGHVGDVPGKVEKTSTGTALVLQPDQTFLADPAVQYPVTLTTSSWVGAGLQDDVFVSSDYPNAIGDATWLHAGKFGSGSKTARTYIRFNAGGPLRGARILNADLRLWNYKSNACGSSVGSGIQVRRVTSDWMQSTLTLSNQPSTTTSGAITQKAAAGDPNCAEAELYYSIENIVQAWADGASDYGVQLRAANESDATNWRMYRSSESAGTGPVLFINFETDAPDSVDFTLFDGSPTVPLNGTEYDFSSLSSVPDMSEEDLTELVTTGQVTREPVLADDSGIESPIASDPEAHPRYDEPQTGEPTDDGPTPSPSPTPPATGSTLNANPSFEEGISPWYPWWGDDELTQSTEQAHEGAASAKLSLGAPECCTGMAQDLSVTPGTYEITGWIRPDADATGFYGVDWYDADWNFLDSSSDFGELTSGRWQPLQSVVVTAPAGTANAVLWTEADFTDESLHTVYLDDLRMAPVVGAAAARQAAARRSDGKAPRLLTELRDKVKRDHSGRATQRSTGNAVNHEQVNTSQLAAEPAGSFDLLAFWRDKGGKKINYRKGWFDPILDRGFGHIKITQKHNLTVTAAYYMTKSPIRGIQQPDSILVSRFHYLATAYDNHCSGILRWKRCRTVRTMNTRTIVDFNTEPWKYADTFGVVTAYCEGVTWCPDWVGGNPVHPILPIPYKP